MEPSTSDNQPAPDMVPADSNVTLPSIRLENSTPSSVKQQEPPQSSSKELEWHKVQELVNVAIGQSEAQLRIATANVEREEQELLGIDDQREQLRSQLHELDLERENRQQYINASKRRIQALAAAAQRNRDHKNSTNDSLGKIYAELSNPPEDSRSFHGKHAYSWHGRSIDTRIKFLSCLPLSQVRSVVHQVCTLTWLAED